jgi:hypothetical protein
LSSKLIRAFQLNLEKAGILHRRGRLNVTDVLLKLEEHSPLFKWIRGQSDVSEQVTEKRAERADCVVVALEQMSIENSLSKHLGKELGEASQQQFDLSSCIAKSVATSRSQEEWSHVQTLLGNN